MDTSSRAYEVAYIRALELVEVGAIRPTGVDGQYAIHTGTPGSFYLARSRRVRDDVISCTCPNARLRRELGVCQHILAAEIYESAEKHVRLLCQDHGMEWGQLEACLLQKTRGNHDKLMRLRLGVLLATVRRLEHAEAQRIAEWSPISDLSPDSGVLRPPVMAGCREPPEMVSGGKWHTPRR
jgi:hypothetical protein